MCNVLSDKDLITKLVNKYKELDINEFNNYFLKETINNIPLPILYIKSLFNKIINSVESIKKFLIDDDNQIVSKLYWITYSNKKKKIKKIKTVLENIFDNFEIIKIMIPLEIFEEGLIRLIYNKTRHCTCSCLSCKKIHNSDFEDNKFNGSIRFYSHNNKKKLEIFEFIYDLDYLTYDGKKIILKSFLDLDLKCNETLINEDIKNTFSTFSTVCRISEEISYKRKRSQDDDTKEYLTDRKRLKIIIETKIKDFLKKWNAIEKERNKIEKKCVTPVSTLCRLEYQNESESKSPTLVF
jgi:hypothetical protein